jgi:hypothetical protein
MDISAIAPQVLPGRGQTPTGLQAASPEKQLSADDAKIADSCKQFEAMMWRQMLDKALQPMLQTPEGNGDKTGAYNFFLTNTVSEAVSGGPNGISSLLQAQLINNQHGKANL